jgi:hypothetical protein
VTIAWILIAEVLQYLQHHSPIGYGLSLELEHPIRLTVELCPNGISILLEFADRLSQLTNPLGEHVDISGVLLS